jgi:hypothetical protein
MLDVVAGSVQLTCSTFFVGGSVNEEFCTTVVAYVPRSVADRERTWSSLSPGQSSQQNVRLAWAILTPLVFDTLRPTSLAHEVLCESWDLENL